MHLDTLEGKNATVVGLGVSGRAACAFLREKGAVVKLTDNSDSSELKDVAGLLEKEGITCELGGHTERFLDGTDILIVSPGVDGASLPVKWAEENNVPAISEIELGYKFCEGNIIAVSGTNGKSTVVSMVGEMLKGGNRRVFVCGNIGVPFTSVVSELSKDDIVVLEISSFQLDRVAEFRPHIALMLNVTDDHLDRYGGFGEYMGAKLKLFTNQSDGDCAILNYDHVKLRKISDSLRPETMYFSKYRLPREHNGSYVENNELIVRRNGRYIWLAGKDSLCLKGEHNLENALAAGLAGLISGADPDAINDVLCNFKGLKHRFEFIGMVDGVRFVDDSKATNIDSAYHAVQSLPKGIVLIAGGRHKGGDYGILAKLLREKARHLILIGEAKESIAGAFSGVVPVGFASDIKEAVGEAFKRSRKGNTVLLSPMCSSFDMFKDYRHRGDAFRTAVEELRQRKS